jgi:hypothetical protein
VRRLYDPRTGTFFYGLQGSDRNTTRAMTAAGIVSLSLGGQHQTEQARQAGRWLLDHPFVDYRRGVTRRDRYFYSLFYCSQAMFQLGGNYWAEFYPSSLRTLLVHQRSDGSWDPESYQPDSAFGSTYTTALTVLALSPPYQMLPIFQR